MDTNIYVCGSLKAVDTGDTYFAEIKKMPITARVEASRRLDSRAWIKSLEVVDDKPLKSRVEHSRWIVDCPNCNGAEFAFEDKLFFCSLCKNSDIEGKSRKVKMPKERKDIEKILGKRKIKNRHWFPDETVDGLIEEG